MAFLAAFTVAMQKSSASLAETQAKLDSALNELSALKKSLVKEKAPIPTPSVKSNVKPKVSKPLVHQKTCTTSPVNPPPGQAVVTSFCEVVKPTNASPKNGWKTIGPKGKPLSKASAPSIPPPKVAAEIPASLSKETPSPSTLKSKFAGKSRDEIISFLTRPRQVEVYQTLLVRNLPHRPISPIRSGLVGLGVDPKKIRDLKFLGPSLAEAHVLKTMCRHFALL